jgi:VanZ family protein
VKFFRLWLPLVLYTALIFWFSSEPRPIPTPIIFPHIDKVLHMLEYLPLGFLALRAVGGTWGGWPGWKKSLVAILWVVCVSATDETYQKFVPNRFSSPFDAVADVAGGFLGQIVWRRFSSLRAKGR